MKLILITFFWENQSQLLVVKLQNTWDFKSYVNDFNIAHKVLKVQNRTAVHVYSTYITCTVRWLSSLTEWENIKTTLKIVFGQCKQEKI